MAEERTLNFKQCKAELCVRFAGHLLLGALGKLGSSDLQNLGRKPQLDGPSCPLLQEQASVQTSLWIQRGLQRRSTAHYAPTDICIAIYVCTYMCV